MDELNFIQPKKIVGKLISADVFDKIKAEMYSLEWVCDGENYFVNRKSVECILDKYKAESEDRL